MYGGHSARSGSRVPIREFQLGIEQDPALAGEDSRRFSSGRGKEDLGSRAELLLAQRILACVLFSPAEDASRSLPRAFYKR